MSTAGSPERLPPFARLLRQLRRTAGLTQDELAKSASVGVRTLRDLETGRAARPQRTTVELLADALGLDSAGRASFVATARGWHSSSGRLASAGRASGASINGSGNNGTSLNGGVPTRRGVAGSPGRGSGLTAEGVGSPFAFGLRPVDDLIGREPTIAALVDLLDVARLVTLVGLAGMGKSALAISVGHRALSRFPGGVGGIAITDAANEADLLASVLAALGVARLDGLRGFGPGRRALLVVDGVERGLKPAVAALERLRALAPEVTVLATSRHPLGVAGEHEWPVGPLELPPPTATETEIFRYSAVEFFLDRLRRVRRRPVGLDEAVILAALVRRLGGVPLALEIAAARGRVLELEEMLARRVSDGSVADPAGQSLRAAVLASWDLLAPDEQACLSQLAVLQWRWSLPTAEALLGSTPADRKAAGEKAAVAAGLDATVSDGTVSDGTVSDGMALHGTVSGRAALAAARRDVVGLVDRLVGLGLVTMRANGVEPRFRVLGAVRDVALAEAARVGSARSARDRHGRVVAALATRNAQLLASADATAVRTAERWFDCYAPDIEAALEHFRTGGGPVDWTTIERLQADLAAWRARRGVSPD